MSNTAPQYSGDGFPDGTSIAKAYTAVTAAADEHLGDGVTVEMHAWDDGSIEIYAMHSLEIVAGVGESVPPGVMRSEVRYRPDENDIIREEYTERQGSKQAVHESVVVETDVLEVDL